MRSHQNTYNRNFPRLCVYSSTPVYNYKNFIIRAPALHLTKHSSFIARGRVLINLTFGKIEFMRVKSGHSLAKRWGEKENGLTWHPQSEWQWILHDPRRSRTYLTENCILNTAGRTSYRRVWIHSYFDCTRRNQKCPLFADITTWTVDFWFGYVVVALSEDGR